ATWLHARVQRETGPAAGERRREALAGEARVVAEGAATGDGAVDRAGAGALVAIGRPVESRIERRLYVVRDDGAVFGDGAGRSIGSLGLEVGLVEPPRAERLWRLRGVQAYGRGERPEPADVLERLVACYDAFV